MKFQNVFPLSEFFRLISCFYYLYQFNVANISTILTTIFVWFVSSEFKWLWLVAGNEYLPRDGVGEVGVLEEDGGLNIEG